MDNKTNKHFCIQPFLNVTTRIQGQNNVCCNIDNAPSNIRSESPTEFFNSPYVKKMRQDLINGEKLKQCKLCHYQEKHHGISQRQMYNEYYFIKDNQDTRYYHNIIKKLRFDQLDKPLYVEMHISNLNVISNVSLAMKETAVSSTPRIKCLGSVHTQIQTSPNS